MFSIVLNASMPWNESFYKVNQIPGPTPIYMINDAKEKLKQYEVIHIHAILIRNLVYDFEKEVRTAIGMTFETLTFYKESREYEMIVIIILL